MQRRGTSPSPVAAPPSRESCWGTKSCFTCPMPRRRSRPIPIGTSRIAFPTRSDSEEGERRSAATAASGDPRRNARLTVEVVVEVDRGEVRARFEQRRSLCFAIHIVHEGVAYPTSIWTDFGVVLLSSWLYELTLLSGPAATCCFNFMDGPFCLT